MIYREIPRAFSRHSTIDDPVVLSVSVVVDKQTAALPAAKGPRATTQSGMSTKSAADPLSLFNFVQALGREVGQDASKAVLRQLMMDPPVVEVVMTSVARQAAALPTPYTPRAVRHRGTSTMRSRPLTDASFAQFGGRETWQPDDGVEEAAGQAVGTTLVVGVADVSLRALLRQVMMLAPVVVSAMLLVERQTSASPTAKGPRATTQAGTSATSARPFSLDRFEQAAGSDEMQVPDKAVLRQETIVVPAVVTLMVSVVKQVATLPTAKGPRAARQSGTSGISARPLELERLSHA